MATIQPISEPPPAQLVLSNNRRWTVVALLFVASLINYFDRATMSMAIPYISKDLGLGPAVKGVLLSAFFWSYALMQIPMGIIADRVNLRWLYAFAFSIWCVAQGLTGLAGTLMALILCRILLGIGEAIYLPGGSKIVSLLFRPGERGLPCGLFDFGTRTGLVLEGIMVPWMLTEYGWRKTFMFVGFTGLLWLLPWILSTPKRLQRDAAQPVQVQTQRFRDLVTNRNFLGICLGFFFFDYYWYVLVTWLPDYLVTGRGATIKQAGMMVALTSLVFGVCEPIGGWFADKLSRKGVSEIRARRWIITIGFLSGLFLIPAERSQNINHAVAFVVGACFVGLATANMLVLLQNCAPPEKIGLWTGIYNFIGNIAGILAPLVTGLLIKFTGSYKAAFVFSAIMIVLGILSFWFIVEDKPQKAH
jgi:MFS transporter, ACS family, D-galactonate transporter